MKDGGSALVYWAVYGAGGLAGLVVLKMAAFGFVIGLQARWLRVQGLSLAVSAIVLGLIVVTVAFRFTIRPQIFSFAILGVYVLLLERCVETPRHRALIWTVVLTWINAWLHRAALLLPIVFLMWFGVVWWKHRLQGDRPAVFRRLFVLLVANVAVCLATPDGTAIVTTGLAMVSDPVLHGAIPEWWPSSFDNVMKASPAMFVVVVVVLVALIDELRTRGRRADAWRVGLMVLGLVVAARGVRFLPYLPLLALVPASVVLAKRAPLEGRLGPVIAVGPDIRDGRVRVATARTVPRRRNLEYAPGPPSPGRPLFPARAAGTA